MGRGSAGAVGDRVERGRDALLRWYRPRRFAYPWRTSPPDPYRVLVSEVMLQQTQASRVAPAFERFIRRFPTVAALAGATRADVLREWDGLGYNRRALALSATARVIASDHGGAVPSAPEALRSLPGVGPYTAAAVASIGHGVAVPAIDTNVRRVVSRAMLGTESATARDIERAAHRWLDDREPGAWNQAAMDLGRLVCRPRPRCAECPLNGLCRFAARAAGRSRARDRAATAGTLPRQPPFLGSSRQVRGAIVRELRSRSPISLGGLSAATGHPLDRVAAAAVALARDGLVRLGPAAVGGDSRGLVRLAPEPGETRARATA